jgi:hypothetical protein
MASPAWRLALVSPVAPAVDPSGLSPGSSPGFVPEPGTLVELSSDVSSGRTTVAAAIARTAQAEGETVAWIMHDEGGVYPPDLAASGLDLDALVFIRIPRRSAAGTGMVRAAELLLRSSGVGLVVLELVDSVPSGTPAAWQGRLLGLAREHHARIVLLSSRADAADSLGPLVTVRLGPKRRRSEDEYLVTLDKLRVKHGRLGELAPLRRWCAW